MYILDLLAKSFDDSRVPSPTIPKHGFTSLLSLQGHLTQRDVISGIYNLEKRTSRALTERRKVFFGLLPHSVTLSISVSIDKIENPHLNIEPFSPSLESKTIVSCVSTGLSEVPRLYVTLLNGHLPTFVIDPTHLYQRQGPGLADHS